jgi:hypothetical protein
MAIYSLADPLTCGQDQNKNMLLSTQAANTFCSGCADYHATIAVGRLTGSSGWSGGMREALVNFVYDEVQRGRKLRPTLSILIMGAADTATLSACAHAVLKAGEEVLLQTAFTVIDRCETPLYLCRDFADQHHLNLLTEIQDLTRPTHDFKADIIIFHSILSFIPREYHISILQRASSWLNPDGRIYLFNALQTQGLDQSKDLRIQDKDKILALIRSGQLAIAEDTDTFHQRLQNRIDRLQAGGFNSGHPDAEYFDNLLKDGKINVVTKTTGKMSKRGMAGEIFTQTFLEAIAAQ